jgi:HK97 family phage portal protein
MMQLSEIARFFGVPEVMIGAGTNGSSAWPASFEQQILSFLTFTLQGYLDEWESALMDALVPGSEHGKIIVDHEVSQFIKMDSQAKASYLSTLAQNGLMSRNEGRKVLNLPKVEGGDELTVQVNLTPIEDLQKVQDATTSQPTKPVQSEVRQ